MKSKQLVIIAAVVILLAIIGGIAIMSARKEQAPQTANTASPQEETQKTSGTMFTSIQDALSRSLSLECTFGDEQGRQTHSYVKSGAIRADITASDPQQSGSMIVKDKKMYFWNAQKQGFTMSLPEVTPGTPNTKMPTRQFSQEQDMMQSMEKYKESCKAATVADSQFVIPTDVKFTDLSTMMQAVPTGMMQGVPTGMMQQSPATQDQINSMMQKYKTPPEDGQ